MRAYIVKRVGLFIPSLVLVSIIVFLLLRVVPGDPALMLLLGEGGGDEENIAKALAQLRAELGTDRPMYVQYGDWVWKMLRLDFGESFFHGSPVVQLMAKRLPVTLQLGLMAMALSTIVALPLGAYSALRQDTLGDHIARAITMAGIAMPNFWVAILMIFFLVLWFGWVPALGYVELWDNPLTNLQQLILPAIAVGTAQTAFLARVTRSATLEVLHEDYIRTARAKGLGEGVVIIRHAVRNSLLPVVTVVAQETGTIISGTVIIEIIFLVPGMGQLLIASVSNRDFPLIQGIVMTITVFILSVNLFTDLLYAWLDPRIRYS